MKLEIDGGKVNITEFMYQEPEMVSSLIYWRPRVVYVFTDQLPDIRRSVF